MFSSHEIDAVIHFAGWKAVGESVRLPLTYYRNNFTGSLVLLEVMKEHGVKNLVFSSSATVYGTPKRVPLQETDPVDIATITNPYGRTKLMIEEMLRDLYVSDPSWNIALLRYFNPIGADPMMRTGPYDPNPSHVLGKMVNVALGKDPVFTVTGVNWPTRDGSGIRDYIHIWDLARAHVKAVEQFDSAMEAEGADFLPINLGTGNGVTVKELVTAFEKVFGRKLNVAEADPRPGDVAGAYANADRAQRLLGWHAEKSIEEGIADALRWTDVERKKVLGY